MVRRGLLVLILMAFPLVTRADTAVVDPSVGSGSGLGPAAAELGPSADSSSTGSSSAESSSLQPTGDSPLQSSSTDSDGLAAPDSSNLQQSGPASQGALQVVLGDADGPTHDATTGGTNYWGWLWFTLIFALLALSLSVFLQKPARILARRMKRSR